MSIGDNIRKWRELRDLKQSELAELVGVSDKTVSSWEVNRTEPKMGMIEKITEALNCKKSDIIGADKSESTSYDEQDIKQDLDNIIVKLTRKNHGPAIYDGQVLSQEAAELFRDELEIALRRLKLINREKDSPSESRKADCLSSTPDHLLLRAAHAEPGAAEEDIAFDNAIMNDENF